MAKELLIAILAAGASRRLGQPKQLVNVAGEPLLRRQCRIALEARIGPVMAILGCRADECAAVIADLPASKRINAHWQEGIASSIREATTAAIEIDAGGLLILHGDQYRVTSSDLQSVHAAWTAAGGEMGCRARHEQYVGPPVILPAACFISALQLRGDEGAKGVLSNLSADNLIDVPMASAIHDLDLPEQLADIQIAADDPPSPK